MVRTKKIKVKNLFGEVKLNKYKVVKKRKDEDTRRLITKLASITGRSLKSIHFTVPHIHLLEAISYCQHFEKQVTRNFKLSEWIKNYGRK